MLTHRNFVSNVMGVVQLLPPRANDNFISVLPLHHTLEFTGGFLVPLYVGATVTYCDTMRSRVILDTMRETRATTLIGVPRVFQILHDAIRRQTSQHGRRSRFWFDTRKVVSKLVRALTGRNVGRRLFARVHEELGGRLRAFVCGGAALAPQIFDHFTAMGFELCEGYGLSECGPIATANPLGAARKGSVGIPLPGVEVDVINKDERGVGEVVVRGPNVTPGYFNNPEATERVLRDGWLHTGDVGYLETKERYLFITGRIKDIIVTAAGKNVYPEEVEHLYAGLPQVARLCVVGVWDDEVLGETIHGVVVPDREGLHAPAFEALLRRAVQDRSRTLPTYQRLQRVHVVEQELPKNALGVVDRPRAQAGLAATAALVAPGSLPLPADGEREPPAPAARNGTLNGSHHAVEEGMRTIVSRLSGVPRSQVGPRSDLEADLRLDSLSKVELLLALETHFQVPLPESLGQSLHTFGDVVEAVRQRVEDDVAVVERPEVVPQWGKVLAPKGFHDDGPWLKAGPGKRRALPDAGADAAVRLGLVRLRGARRREPAGGRLHRGGQSLLAPGHRRGGDRLRQARPRAVRHRRPRLLLQPPPQGLVLPHLPEGHPLRPHRARHRGAAAGAVGPRVGPAGADLPGREAQRRRRAAAVQAGHRPAGRGAGGADRAVPGRGDVRRHAQGQGDPAAVEGARDVRAAGDDGAVPGAARGGRPGGVVPQDRRRRAPGGAERAGERKMIVPVKPLPGTTIDPRFPDEDGRPMGDTDFHSDALIWLREALQDFLALAGLVRGVEHHPLLGLQ